MGEVDAQVAPEDIFVALPRQGRLEAPNLAPFAPADAQGLRIQLLDLVGVKHIRDDEVAVFPVEPGEASVLVNGRFLDEVGFALGQGLELGIVGDRG